MKDEVFLLETYSIFSEKNYFIFVCSVGAEADVEWHDWKALPSAQRLLARSGQIGFRLGDEHFLSSLSTVLLDRKEPYYRGSSCLQLP